MLLPGISITICTTPRSVTVKMPVRSGPGGGGGAGTSTLGPCHCGPRPARIDSPNFSSCAVTNASVPSISMVVPSATDTLTRASLMAATPEVIWDLGLGICWDLCNPQSHPHVSLQSLPRVDGLLSQHAQLKLAEDELA